ncbi:MAG: helix-turn-helix domain-containing protein, partial [Anaerovoracaceae bacterium]
MSVLMYQLSDDYGYETVNVDISSEYEGIKLFDWDDAAGMADGKYLYLIEAEELARNHLSFLHAEALSTAVFICLCPEEKSAVCTKYRDLSVVYLFADVSFAYIFNRIQAIMKKFDQWEKTFHLSLLRKCSMQDLVDITEELMTHPLLILDNNYTVVGHTRDMREVGPLIREVIQRGYASPDHMRRLVDRGITSDLDSFASPTIHHYCLSLQEVQERGLDRDTFYSITYRFVVEGRVAGYALVFHCLSEPTNGYLYLMNMIAEKLQLFFEREKQADRVSEEAYQSFLSGIMANPQMSWRQICEQAGHIPGMPTEGTFLLAQLRYNRLDEISYSFVSWSLRNAMPHFMPFVYRDCFYILKVCGKTGTGGRPAGKEPPGGRIPIQEGSGFSFLQEDEKKIFQRCFRNMDYCCAVSEPFFSLNKLNAAAVQCREALSIGGSQLWNNARIRLLRQAAEHGSRREPDSSTDSGTFYRYEEVSFLHVLAQLRKVVPPESLESPYYELLSRYDAREGTDLCNVMAVHILCGCSATKTAAVTYMHRNTILNKVKKAAEIMGNPLEQFSCQVFFLMAYVNS